MPFVWSTGAKPDEPLAADTEWALVDESGNAVVAVNPVERRVVGG